MAADRRRGRGGRSRRSSTPTARSSRCSTPPFGGAALRALPRASAAIRHAMVAMLPGENRVIGTIMLANRFGVVRAFSRRGPAAVRGARQQRQRRAAVRPARAGGRPAARRSRSSCTTRPSTTRSPTCPTARCSWSACARRSTTAPSDVAVLFIDLDDFKTVNDTLGHAVGDALLVAVAEPPARAACARRTSIARLGGDEFAVMLPGRRATPRRAARVGRDAHPARRSSCPSRPATSCVVRAPQRRHRLQPPGRRRRRRADPQRRPRDVPGQDAKGKGRFELFEPPMARPRCCAATTSRRSWRKAVERERDGRRVPADRRARHGPRSSAAEALVRWEHPGAAASARGVHPARRGDRPDRRARPLRAARGLPAGARAGRTRDRGRRAAARAREPLARSSCATRT